MKAIWFGGLIVMLTQISWSQDYKSISMDSLSSAIQSKNLSIKINTESLNMTQAQYRESNAAILPQLSISHQGFRTNNPVMAFGSKLNQGVFNQSDFDVNALNNPEALSNFTTTLEVAQPVLNIDKLIQRKALKYASRAQEFQNNYRTSALILKSKTLYMQLQLAYGSEKVIEKALKTANLNKTQTQNLYEEGLIQKADLLAAQMRHSEVETQSIAVQNQIQNLSDQIKQLIQDEAEAILKPTDSLQMIDMWSDSRIESTNIENTSDIKAFELKAQSFSELYKAQRYSFLPTLNAFGQLQFFDDEIFGTSSDNYFFGAELKWDLFKGYSRIAKLQKTKAEAEKVELEQQNYLQQKQNDVKQSIRNIEMAEQNMNSHKIAVQQSQEAFRILKNRYDEGLEKTTDVLAAETKYANTQLAYLQSVFNYNYNLLYYQFLTEK
ncbi:TolC family protein [Mesohalobacter halotolerans]|uniref:TolC family protein n=1 Tax=Mesohalobacter halotolerans TaxID=1883405 RepID=A0A4U5TR09_9FLAO|nr:TolC family protein [Mesohalobacter halotolerans]MBS3737678.1 TolC family protein [Psychroflexus sp.]TKS56506.1 TolC family protein [Mesohalobacter halotolerans]